MDMRPTRMMTMGRWDDDADDVLGARRHNVQWNSGLAWSKFLAQRTVWISSDIKPNYPNSRYRHSIRSIRGPQTNYQSAGYARKLRMKPVAIMELGQPQLPCPDQSLAKAWLMKPEIHRNHLWWNVQVET